MRPARLILEDGTVYGGAGFGSDTDAIGEVVFNTSNTGYQEILTDPSYRFQIVLMTYPHIGNYGVEEVAEQSDHPQAAGLLVRDIAKNPSPDDHRTALDDYLIQHRVPGLAEIDTRALTRKLRDQGAMKGLITSSESRSIDSCLAELHEAPSMTGLDLVQRVTALRPYLLTADAPGCGMRIAVYDFGVKRDILKRLARTGCEVVVYPASTHAEEVLSAGFDGVVLSNGPGDPEPVTYAQHNIRHLIGKLPLFGICLGHQLLGLALGGRTYKLKFGHHGGNHPVKELASGRVEITAQNHGFSVDGDSLNPADVEFTHVNLNDGTLEGFRHRREPIIAVQYHPEAAPGPHDSFYLFDEFIRMMQEFR